MKNDYLNIYFYYTIMFYHGGEMICLPPLNFTQWRTLDLHFFFFVAAVNKRQSVL